jgi:6-phosphogluconolactonase
MPSAVQSDEGPWWKYGHVWLVVSGEAKADAVAAAIGGADPADVPAAGAIGIEATVWLLDAAAARRLTSKDA